MSGVRVSTAVAESEGIEIRLLGEARVRIGGELVDGVRSGRARSLLAYLVLNPATSHTRQRLAFMFWPDSSESQARTNLRNVLHALRKAHPILNESLLVTATTLQWSPRPSASVDVERFSAAVGAARSADPDNPPELIARCRAAIELYTGDLLEGDTDEWLLPLREELRDRYRDALRTLATALIDSGQANEATALTRELVRSDPLDESAHRLRIEAHEAAGDRAGAVRSYHECVATLEREVGVAPGPATVALYASLVEARGDTATTQPLQVVRGPRRLVGREAEWALLLESWHGVHNGSPSVVFVTGEPGVGKTRLVHELRTWCSASGAAVGEARSYETEGELGYSVIVSWLRSRDISAGLQRLPPAQVLDLARLLPELGLTTTAEVDEAERRRRLFDAVVAALTAVGRATLLIADDAQWSDNASLELIHYLIRQPVPGPLLVAVTARAEDLDASHPLTQLRDALAVLDRVTELRLERLTPEATADLGQELLGSRLDQGDAAALFEESEGNPLFVVESVRAGWTGGGASVGLTPHLRAVIDGRLRRLSDEAAAIASIAAAIGRPCSAGLIGALSGLDDVSLGTGLDELWQRGILCEAGFDAYDFTHGKLREAAYDRVPPRMRRDHHRRIARTFSELAGRVSGISSAQVAGHFEAAGEVAEAVEWFQRSADEAQAVFAYDEAIRLLDRALALVPDLPAEVRHTRELEVLAALPVALAGISGYSSERMGEAHGRAVGIAQRLGVELEPPFVRSMVMAALCRDEFAQAAEAARRLFAQATANGDEPLRLESHYLLGISAFWAGAIEEAREHFETVVTDFDPSMRPRHHVVYGHDPQVVCLSRLANTLWFLGFEDDARSTCAGALDLAATVDHPLSRETALVFASLLAIEFGDHERIRVYSESFRNATSLPMVTNREALLGLVDVLDGRPGDGIERVRAAIARCQGRNFYPAFQAALTRILLAAHTIAGDAAGGLDTCARALAMTSTPLWEPEVHRARAEFLQATGAGPAEVAEALDAAKAVAHRLGATAHLRRVAATRNALIPGRRPNGSSNA